MGNKNQLTGTIPESIGKLTALTVIDFDNNQLTGSIPDSISKLSALTNLALDNNQLTGTIPESMDKLKKLSLCNMNSDNFTCPLPAYAAVCTATCTDMPRCGPTDNPDDCQALSDLYDATNGHRWQRDTNWVSGSSVCTWFGVKCDANGRVSELALDGNTLKGSIPDSIDKLTALTLLSLRSNQLNGTIPDSISKLT